MLSMQTASLSYAFSAPAAPSRASVRMETKEDLQALAVAQNPTVGFWDPIGLADANLFDLGEEGSIGWLRHAEIKHGRVAMAGFVGYIIHENGIHWPWALYNGCDYSTFQGLSAPATWDALPEASKYQIVLFVGFLELWGESSYNLAQDGEKHYMRGGKPGYFPPFGGPVPDLVFGRAGITRASAETNAKRLNVEVNNGRLAMIGLFGFLAEANCPGAVPGLTGLIKPYGGPKIMSPDWLYNTWECMVPSTDACWFADGPAAAAPAVIKAAATAAAPAVEAASGAFEAAASAL